MHQIIVQKAIGLTGAPVFKAFFADDVDADEYGDTPEEAIGKLVVANLSVFKVSHITRDYDR